MATFRTLTDVIKHPIMTEKSYAQTQTANTYTFAVHKDATKPLIKEAVSKIFDVKILSVNIINTKKQGKRMGKYAGFKSGFKKAIVKLAPGQVIGGENQDVSITDKDIKDTAKAVAPKKTQAAPKAVKATKANTTAGTTPAINRTGSRGK